MPTFLFPSFLLLLSFLCFPSPSSSSLLYNVQSFGAVSGATSDATSSFLKAWASACSSASPSTLYVPPGRFLLRSLALAGPCRSSVTFRSEATLLAPSEYWGLGNSDYWIMFINVTRLSVVGGVYDARGSSYWSCVASRSSCTGGANTLAFEWSNDVHNVRLNAPSQSPNTDGIHVQSSTGVSVFNARITTGDDCISLGPGTKNVFIKRVACGPGHGISIGSLGNTAQEDGVQNITVTGVVFTGTQNGVRIKSWARQSTGFARDITFRNIVMKNVYNPIIIDQKYCPDNNCPNQNSGVQISRVSYKHVRGTSATQVAVSLICSPTRPCWGISLKNIDLTSPGQTTTSYCEHAGGTASGIVVPKSCL
ncbi:hypothetical protein MLD38_012059 [Melastoma candidum]|uniref:Uncharacterized protein n=1 Tax=Melastoma candidum TaxID=119954 RepID=A0ACB9R541_9MYRT|nr:hypothetical protein MLD38_012059 [Melastoma candidum]